MFWKLYYSDPLLNALANMVWHGCVFGETTMLNMLGECCDVEQFVELIGGAL